MIVLASIGIPAACGLHGYVGFIFGAIKANPWWASPLMPVIFLLSAIVSGVAMVMLCYIVIHWLQGREINGECVHALIETAWYFLIIDVALEMLELINHAYMANEDWTILKELVTGKLFVSMFIIQILLGSVVPFFVMGYVVVFKQRVPAMVRNLIAVCCGLLLLAQVGAMRWNVVMGGQMFSKSLRGFLNFQVDIYGREGLIAGAVILCLPFVVIFVFSRLLPLWGSVETFPKEWMKETPPVRQPLKGWSKFTS
jgi:Ni/Fe-hydrogenase subunit HybB-like protein